MKAPKKQAASAEEQQLDRISQETWSDYVARFRPAEAALIEKAEFTAGERASVKGQVSGDVAGAFKGLARDTVATGGKTGANVNSGKTKLSLASDATAAGRAKGAGQSVAETGGELDSEQQKIGIMATGRGQAHSAVANLAQGARRATSVALAESASRFERNRSIVEGVATVAGAAVRRFGGEDVFGLFESDLEKEPKKTATGIKPLEVNG